MRTTPMRTCCQWSYAYPFEGGRSGHAALLRQLPGTHPAVLAAIQDAYAFSMSATNADNLPAYIDATDAYGAYLATNNYTWGSNTTKGHQGSMFTTMNTHGLDGANAANYEKAAGGFVHYFHGVNPNNTAYLTNMGAFGAEHSVNSIYHGWFTDGSALWDEAGVSTYGPAPGFVPGGPNPTYDWDTCCPNNCGSVQNNALCIAESIEPPKNQPAQKSWKDFNTNWPINSWTVTEIGIYTQAAYVRMLSRFCSPGCLNTGMVAPSSSTPIELSVHPNPAQDLLMHRTSGRNIGPSASGSSGCARTGRAHRADADRKGRGVRGHQYGASRALFAPGLLSGWGHGFRALREDRSTPLGPFGQVPDP
ncbi:MAG: glycoside hydrolase family 9 protein [Flavobacteriales bacterium]|nr:glycoside hydrolase family 9 protein [Flavobacteriales bacterium]